MKRLVLLSLLSALLAGCVVVPAGYYGDGYRSRGYGYYDNRGYGNYGSGYYRGYGYRDHGQ